MARLDTGLTCVLYTCSESCKVEARRGTGARPDTRPVYMFGIL